MKGNGMIAEEASKNPFWEAYVKRLFLNIFESAVTLRATALKVEYAKLNQAELKMLEAAADTCQESLAELLEALKSKRERV